MIKIKPQTRDDIKYRVKWLNDPTVNKYIGDTIGQCTTLKKQEKWFDDYKKVKGKKFFTIYDNDKPIGWMGLSNINKTNKNADIFLAIGEDEYRGKGYGKIALLWLIDYAFKKLNLHKINLGVIENNIFAIKLYKSVGFEVEGKMKDEVWHDGIYYNFLSMALFNNE